MSTRPVWTAAPGLDAVDIYALRSDSVDLPAKHGVYPLPFVHVAGDIKVTTVEGTDLTLTMPAGSQYPCRIKRLWSSSTTATSVTGIY